LGSFPVTLLVAIHAKAIQNAAVAVPVKGFSKSSSDRLEGSEETTMGGLSGGLQGGLLSGAGGEVFKPEFRASALGLDKQARHSTAAAAATCVYALKNSLHLP
jgi:hypothetical protein